MKEPKYDVFLSSSVHDDAIARRVAQSLSAAGFDVFTADSAAAATPTRDQIVKAIAESVAFVAVFSAQSSNNPRIGVETGAALAWLKPIFFVTERVNAEIAPVVSLSAARVFDLSQLDDLVFNVKQLVTPLTAKDREALAASYASLKVPTDQLISQPTTVRDLADEFNRRGSRRVSGERLVQELLRMRKAGELPRTRGREKSARRQSA